jgi:hypothetical protein
VLEGVERKHETIRLRLREVKFVEEPPVKLGQSLPRTSVRPSQTTEAAPAIAHVTDALFVHKKLDQVLRELIIRVFVSPLKKTAVIARPARLTSRGTEAAGDDEARRAALPEWQ